jgi:S-DNA-T family DNA segregation ATPase FtsK/SpoIIIE
MLIAGSTGSGKSVCTNSIIVSILMRYRPDEVKLVLVDPKQVELSNYNGIPHLLLPVVTDPKRASATLQRIVAEMDDRYRTFAENSVKKIDDYNAMIDEKNKKRPADDKLKKMPYIVVIIDEMADLMLVARKEVEDSILRITQLARAAGIHLITATQRPSTDIITGVIKANIPSRIAFAVASQVDSRTILDGVGAEKLLGKGDMLFLPVGQNTAMRIQGCFVSDEEIAKVIDAVKSQQTAVYDEKYANVGNEGPGGASNGIGSGPGGTDDDPMYEEVYQFVLETGKASSSLLQRRFRLGYNRAARLIDTLEERGVIGPSTGTSKPREVLIGKGGTEEDE